MNTGNEARGVFVGNQMCRENDPEREARFFATQVLHWAVDIARNGTALAIATDDVIRAFEKAKSYALGKDQK